jgi:hypothetical protein
VSIKRLKQLVIIFWSLVFVLLVILVLVGVFSNLFPFKGGLPAKAAATDVSILPSSTPFQPDVDSTPTSSPIPSTPTTRPNPTLGPDGIMVEPMTIFPTSTPPDALANSYSPVVSPGINPLTGLPPEALDLLDRRPISVKVTLFPRYVRKWQAGLMKADVVYEYYIEDGLSRFIAVVYGNDATRVGPVRSGRYFDEHIMRMYHAYLFYANADERVRDHFNTSDLQPFFIIPGPNNCPPMCRDNSINNFNNYFVNTTRFAAYLVRVNKDNTRPSLRANFLSESPASSSQEGKKLYITYSNYSYHYWQYDDASHKYLRFQDTTDTLNGHKQDFAPLVDSLTDEQVSASNVVVIFVPHRFMNEYEKQDQVFHIDLMGTGKAYLFRDGTVTPASWWRVYVEQPIVITDPAGNPLPLKPGNIFYEVLGSSSTQYTLDGEMHFDWVIP